MTGPSFDKVGLSMGDTLHEQFLNRILIDETSAQEAMSRLVLKLGSTDVLSVIGARRAFLCPAVLSGLEVAALAVDLGRFLDLLVTLPRRLYNGDASAMCDAVGISGVARDAVVRTWDRDCVRLGRADLLRDAGGFKLVEFNVHSRMGGFESAALAQTVLGIPLFRQVAAEMGLGFVNTVEGLSNVLWDLIQLGINKSPVIAVMDWPTEFPSSNATRISTLLCERGFDAFPCNIRQVRAREGALVVADRVVNVVYRTFLLDDLDALNPALDTVLAAVESGTINLVMGFGAELIGSKGALALLSDPANALRFTRDDRELVDRYVPWTRVLRPGSTVWQGHEMDLRDVAIRAQDDLVLKPTVGRGGQGVTAGWVTPARTWQSAVDRALDGPVRFVLQERVPPITDRMTWMTPSGITAEEVVLNWGVFVFDGRYKGCIVRGDTPESHPIIGVGADAAVACCIHPHLP